MDILGLSKISPDQVILWQWHFVVIDITLLYTWLVMIVLVVGGHLAGFWGMLLAVPITAAIRDVFLYLYLRLLDTPLSPAEAVARIRSKVEVVMEA